MHTLTHTHRDAYTHLYVLYVYVHIYTHAHTYYNVYSYTDKQKYTNTCINVCTRMHVLPFVSEPMQQAHFHILLL